MDWFSNLNTRSKLTAVFAPIIALLILIIATAWYYLASVHRADQSLAHMITITGNFNAKRAALLSALESQSDTTVHAYLREIDERSRQDVALLAQLSHRFQTDRHLAGLIERMKAARMGMVRVRDQQILPLVKEKQRDQAAALVLGPYVELEEKYRKSSEELANEVRHRAERFLLQAQLITIALGLLAIATAITAVLGLTRTIAAPLQQIIIAADNIAQGDIHAEVGNLQRQDEIGMLDQAFRRMCESLQSFTKRAQRISQGDLTATFQPRSEHDTLGHAFATMSGNLRSLMQEFHSAMQVLSTSSTQIQATVAQLSNSAVETATAVTETTATVEQVKQTTQLASEKARQVAKDAQRAVDIAKQGETSVDHTVADMNGIRSQMGIVAETILNLSTQSQAIGEIISTVDDLAAQSKLLAVNASIEAAKAGDEGKGFSVVAQEVRRLAEQSRQATNQVRSILSDIQKATSSAVLATEQGGKSVDTGVAQSTASGESIRLLSETVAQAAQASTEIAASSQQQSAGMDQVALAMGNIRNASNQAVASTKQAESAAHQLHALGLKLKQLVERFQV